MPRSLASSFVTATLAVLATCSLLVADDFAETSFDVNDLGADLASAHSFDGGADYSCLCDDDKPLIRLKTRVFFDNVWSTDYAGAVDSSLDHSRFSVDDTRIGIEGWLRDNLYYRAEMGFVRSEPTRFSIQDDVDMGDVYVELVDTAVGNVRFGHFVEPFSLERQSRKELLPFMERSVATRNFAPGRNLGVMVYDHLPNRENFSWFVGAFRGNKRDDFANSTSNDWTATGRVAWLAHYNACDQRLLHIGFGATARRTGAAPGEEGNGLWTGRVPLGDLSSLIEIQVNPNSEFNVYNIELAWAKGPLTLQGEAYHAETNGQRLYMTGAYAQVSYFLTGEHREYDRTMKSFGRVYPSNPVLGGCQRGKGAWEVVARYGFNDLDYTPALFVGAAVPPVVIGDQRDVTVGVNWYLSSNTRVMVNYVRSKAYYTFIGGDNADHVGARIAWDY